MNKGKKEAGVTYLCAVGFAMVVGFSSVANKVCSVYAVPFLLLTIRYFLSTTGNLALQKAGVIRVSFKGKKQRGYLIITAVAYVGSHLFQVCGLVYAPSILNGILFATVPIWAEVLARIVLKEKTSVTQNLFALLSIGSVIAMFLAGEQSGIGAISVKGFLLLFVSCLCEAVNNVMIRFLKKEYSPMEIGFSSGVISLSLVGILLIVQLAAGLLQPEAVLAPFSDPRFLVAAIYLGLGCTLTSGLLKGYILQHMSALKASAWNNVSTAISVAAGVIILKETFQLYQILCTVGILTGVIGLQICKEKR